MVSLLGAAYLTDRSGLRWTTIVVGAGFAGVGLIASGILLFQILTSPGPDSGIASMLVIILFVADVAPGVLTGGVAWWLERRAKREK